MGSLQTYAFFLTYCTVFGALHARTLQKKWIGNVTENVLRHPGELDLNIMRRVLRHGYSAREYIVETEDGYVLTMFQMQRPGGVKGLPVLLMHGLLQSAEAWLDTGPGVALAYLLADAGYDIWLGNVRGTHYSRRHAWLNPDVDSQYWRFCVDEIGRYDLPTFVDTVLSKTGAQKLNYIGYSQGGGTFFIMCSERPEYCEKVNVMIALAPATRHLKTKSLLFKIVSEFFVKLEEELHLYGIWEVFPKGGLFQSFLQVFCALSDMATKVCEALKDALDGSNPGSIAPASIRTAMNSYPAGTSVHNMARYGQSTARNFQKFDYGADQNLVYYGSETPPVYNLSAVTVPTVVIYGRNDGLVNIRDVKWLIRKLPNVLEAFEVEDPLWSHMDVVLSKNTPKFLYPKIDEYLLKYK